MRSNTVIIKYCLASVLTLTVFLSCLGCGGGTAAETDAGYLPESSPFSEEQNDEMMAYGFGLVSPDPDTNIVYDGEPVEVEYYIDNDSVPISTGMLMFVNGIPQPCSSTASRSRIRRTGTLRRICIFMKLRRMNKQP